MNNLKGFRTYTANSLGAITSLLMLFGIQIDPQVVVNFINEFIVWIVSGKSMLYAAVHYFRSITGDDHAD